MDKLILVIFYSLFASFSLIAQNTFKTKTTFRKDSYSPKKYYISTIAYYNNKLVMDSFVYLDIFGRSTEVNHFYYDKIKANATEVRLKGKDTLEVNREKIIPGELFPFNEDVGKCIYCSEDHQKCKYDRKGRLIKLVSGDRFTGEFLFVEKYVYK